MLNNGGRGRDNSSKKNKYSASILVELLFRAVARVIKESIEEEFKKGDLRKAIAKSLRSDPHVNTFLGLIREETGGARGTIDIRKFGFNISVEGIQPFLGGASEDKKESEMELSPKDEEFLKKLGIRPD